MAGAYTPGLTVSRDVVVRRTRRLPIKGEVLVAAGQEVGPETVVARAELPGALQTMKVAERLGVEARDVPSVMRLAVGAPVAKDEVLAEGKKLFGLFKAPLVTSDYAGTIESVSEVTGNVLVREASLPIDIDAYITGRVAEILPGEGAIVETRGAMVQGIFGVGGERRGTVRVAVATPEEPLDEGSIRDSDRGLVLVGGLGITAAAIRRAASVGVVGLVAGGIKDSDLTDFLGYDIGVAITGAEAIPLTILVTEGFGYLAMARRTFELLKTLEGGAASINGATQIRAGVIRPEIIVPHAEGAVAAERAGGALELVVGTPVRVIREPFFGLLGTVTGLPAQLVTLDSGTTVRVLAARLDDGREVTVPRANVEIIATGG